MPDAGDSIKLVRVSGGNGLDKMNPTPPQCPYRSLSDDWETVYFCMKDEGHDGQHATSWGTDDGMWFMPESIDESRRR